MEVVRGPSESGANAATGTGKQGTEIHRSAGLRRSIAWQMEVLCQKTKQPVVLSDLRRLSSAKSNLRNLRNLRFSHCLFTAMQEGRKDPAERQDQQHIQLNVCECLGIGDPCVPPAFAMKTAEIEPQITQIYAD